MRGAPVPRRRARRRRRPFLAILLAFGVAAVPMPLLSRSDGTRGKTVGVVVTSSQSRAQAAVTELTRVQALGANTAGLTTFWEADPEASTVSRGRSAPSDADLVAVIRRAKSMGMRVALEPMLKCYTCDPPWRGAIRPRDTDAFFESYRSMVNHYAALSQAHGVDLLFVGSEMVTMQVHAEQWREVIRQARERYGGKIAYESNWDTPHTVGFWDAVDVVGVSAYFPLTDEASPDVDELKAAWHRPRPGAPRGWVGLLADLARATGKPVIFGEIGYRSIDHTARRPFDFTVSESYNATAQANAYQALLETFEPQPWWMGVLWWEWLVPFNEPDTGFTPRDKPAEQLLRRWWAEGWRPDQAAESARGAGPGAGPGAGGGSSTGGPTDAGPAGVPGEALAPGEEGSMGGIVLGTDGETGVASPSDVIGARPDQRAELAGLAAAAGLLLGATALLVRREVGRARRRRAVP